MKITKEQYKSLDDKLKFFGKEGLQLNPKNNQPMTDKELQTCYVATHEVTDITTNGEGWWHYSKEIKSVYIHTPEELEVLKNKWEREAAEKAWNACYDRPYASYLTHENRADKETYLNTNHPIK